MHETFATPKRRPYAIVAILAIAMLGAPAVGGHQVRHALGDPAAHEAERPTALPPSVLPGAPVAQTAPDAMDPPRTDRARLRLQSSFASAAAPPAAVTDAGGHPPRGACPQVRLPMRLCPPGDDDPSVTALRLA